MLAAAESNYPSYAPKMKKALDGKIYFYVLLFESILMLDSVYIVYIVDISSVYKFMSS